MSVKQQWEQQWLPLRPLASNDLRHGIYRMSRPDALEKLHIEANPTALSNLLVVDIDHADAALRAQWNRAGWLPNVIVENPRNGHAHAIWALKTPFSRTEYARRAPLAFAAAVTEGLRRSVDGDQGYSGLITKNPVHQAWEAEWVADHLYELDELREHLDGAGFMPPLSWTRTRRKKPVGLGRNCDIFESARTWAYRAVRNHFGDAVGLHDSITNHVHALNAEYSEPLTHAEAKAIAESIWRWITTKSRMWADGAAVYEATFTLIQHHRGRKGGQASGEARRAAIRKQLLEGLS